MMRRLHARRRLHRQRFAAALGTILAAMALGAALAGISLTIPGQAALLRGEHHNSTLARALLASYRRTVGYAGRSRFIGPLPRRAD